MGLGLQAQAATVIKIGHGVNDKLHMHRALLCFEELVEKGSNGDLEIQIYPSSQMGPDREMIEGVQSGVLEMAIPLSSFFAGWDPSFAVIELPYVYQLTDDRFNDTYTTILRANNLDRTDPLQWSFSDIEELYQQLQLTDARIEETHSRV